MLTVKRLGVCLAAVAVVQSGCVTAADRLRRRPCPPLLFCARALPRTPPAPGAASGAAVPVLVDEEDFEYDEGSQAALASSNQQRQVVKAAGAQGLGAVRLRFILRFI